MDKPLNQKARTSGFLGNTAIGNTEDLGHAIALMNLLKSITAAANEADSIFEGFQTAINSICAYTGWTVGHAFIYSEEKKKLESLNVWYIQDVGQCKEFKRVTEATQLAPREGFLGEVFADSTPMWVLDVVDSSVYTRKIAAVEAGLKAAFAFPIFIGRKAVGVIEFYSPNACIPDANLLSVMGNVGKQLGQVVERTQFKEKAQLLETVIASANDAIMITKACDDPADPEIMYVNEAFTKMSGYAPQETIGKTPRLLQGEFTSRETLDKLAQARMKGEPFKAELLNYHKNGSTYWVETSMMPVRNQQGVITHYASIEHDISARKQSENEFKNLMVQLKRTSLKAEASARDLKESLEKAEAANIAKSDFLANMSHELRTPMNGVLGMAHLLADTELSDEQKQYVSTINGSAENLLMLLNDILDFSKIEAGALVLENIAFNLKDILHGATSLLRPQAEKKHVELILGRELQIPNFVWGDPGRLRQVITNLMGNAIKFTDRGHVRLMAQLQNDDGDQTLYVSVEDTGMGIPAHKLGEIFDKFTQGDASVTRKYGGTGLGLAITKQLVSLMGGEIGVESAEGKGSTFWFTVPCKLAEENDVIRAIDQSIIHCQASEILIPTSEARVLLVEDYPVNQIFAEKLLRKFGFRHIDMAENGLEALNKCKLQSYDIIFMDCQMPELDGYQTTAKLRALEANGSTHTPVVAMTANAMMGDREKCLKAGMDDYLSKPLRAEHLKKTLQTWFMLDEEKSAVTAPQSTAGRDEEAAVDIEQLRLFTSGAPEEEQELATLFLDQAQEMIDILKRSLNAEKQDEWKSAAHRFKGSSGNLGATKLHQLCKRAEQHSDGSETEKNAMLLAIEDETSRVGQFFNISRPPAV